MKCTWQKCMPFQTTAKDRGMNRGEYGEGVKVVGNPICVTPQKLIKPKLFTTNA